MTNGDEINFKNNIVTNTRKQINENDVIEFFYNNCINNNELTIRDVNLNIYNEYYLIKGTYKAFIEYEINDQIYYTKVFIEVNSSINYETTVLFIIMIIIVTAKIIKKKVSKND